MRLGEIVETLPGADIVAGRVQHPYTRELLANCFPGKHVLAPAQE
jgi:peptide/nickel transport system ATP-binding protein